MLILSITLLMILDYLDIESFQFFNKKTYPQHAPTRFVFEETWKGRMFYLFFIWLFFVEFILDWEKIANKTPKSRIRIISAFICAFIPTLYVLLVNFVPNANQFVIEIGQNLGITGDLSSENFLTFHWPLSFEYLIFWVSFTLVTILSYGKVGLGVFSISLSLLGSMTFMYMIDTLYPNGLFTPLQMFALPTAASAAAFLQLLGYKVSLQYPGPFYSQLPFLGISGASGAYIGWPCAGVHSLLLFVLIISLFFKRSEISSLRKAVYFVFGLLGTYFVNILRISSILIMMINDVNAARIFHDVYGELYFLAWMLFYLLIIVFIQRYLLVERIRQSYAKLCFSAVTFKNKLGQKLRQVLFDRKKKV